MTVLRFVLGDQLSISLSSLSDLDPANDVILMAEVMEEATYTPHHTRKIAFVFSAMRHFAATMEKAGATVRYVRLDDTGNTGTLRGELIRATEDLVPDRVVVTEAGEWRLRSEMAKWQQLIGTPVELREDDRFVCSHEEFRSWADGRKQLRMEFFYRDMRRKTGLLMTAAGKPEGGQWNFDTENRRSLPAGLAVPKLTRFEPDSTTLEVLDLVSDRFSQHFGDLDAFDYAVTAEEAETALQAFLDKRLAGFGPYQDAMKQGEDHLFHAVISMYLNVGLLDPVSVCRRAERAYLDGAAPLNAVEGFIRQIIGWREYVRGIYWLHMPDYAQTNYLEANRPLPSFYWTGDTKLNCLHQAIDETRRLAYAHHIQRLMITGNFALLVGVRPQEICDWYLAVYADAYEWVELPNTHGMAIFADGGVMASKPYAASGAYIDRMSDYCRGCRYDVKQKTGDDACPFNYLYWNFLMKNAEKLRGNRRLAMPYRTLDRMDPDRKASIQRDSGRFLEELSK